MLEILHRYNPWWERGYEFSPFFPRPILQLELQKRLEEHRVVIVTGLRRVGKTTLMKMTIANLIKSDRVEPSHLFFISLDDYMLSKLSIIEIVEEFRKAQALKVEEPVILFLDEVTYKEDFEIQLKNLHDSQNVKVVASLSSASILKSKKQYLTGRHSTVEVLPLDFGDYKSFRNISISPADGHLQEVYFEKFLQTGGIPEFVLTGNIDYLKDLVDDIIRKDIASHYKVRDVQLLKDYFLLLMERAGKVVSINKVANILGIAPDSARRYLDMFIETYLVYAVPRFGKTNERLLSPKKVYAADLGIRNLFTGFRDKGSLFENYVFLKIKHKNPGYVYSDGTELDFMTEDGTLIEVKYGSGMTEKQSRLFNEFPAREKRLITKMEEIK